MILAGWFVTTIAYPVIYHGLLSIGIMVSNPLAEHFIDFPGGLSRTQRDQRSQRSQRSQRNQRNRAHSTHVLHGTHRAREQTCPCPVGRVSQANPTPTSYDYDNRGGAVTLLSQCLAGQFYSHVMKAECKGFHASADACNAADRSPAAPRGVNHGWWAGCRSRLPRRSDASAFSVSSSFTNRSETRPPPETPTPQRGSSRVARSNTAPTPQSMTTSNPSSHPASPR